MEHQPLLSEEHREFLRILERKSDFQFQELASRLNINDQDLNNIADILSDREKWENVYEHLKFDPSTVYSEDDFTTPVDEFKSCEELLRHWENEMLIDFNGTDEVFMDFLWN